MINKFLVGTQGEEIAILRRVPTRMTKDEALNLAAWLAVMADDKPGEADGAFAKALRDVMET